MDLGPKNFGHFDRLQLPEEGIEISVPWLFVIWKFSNSNSVFFPSKKVFLESSLKKVDDSFSGVACPDVLRGLELSDENICREGQIWEEEVSMKFFEESWKTFKLLRFLLKLSKKNLEVLEFVENRTKNKNRKKLIFLFLFYLSSRKLGLI